MFCFAILLCFCCLLVWLGFVAWLVIALFFVRCLLVLLLLLGLFGDTSGEVSRLPFHPGGAGVYVWC